MGITNRMTWRSRQLARETLRRLMRAWAAHLRLLQSSRAYEAAMASAAAHMITQTSWERLIAALVSGLLDIYAAMRRATSPSSGPNYGWEM